MALLQLVLALAFVGQASLSLGHVHTPFDSPEISLVPSLVPGTSGALPEPAAGEACPSCEVGRRIDATTLPLVATAASEAMPAARPDLAPECPTFVRERLLAIAAPRGPPLS